MCIVPQYCSEEQFEELKVAEHSLRAGYPKKSELWHREFLRLQKTI